MITFVVARVFSARARLLNNTGLGMGPCCYIRNSSKIPDDSPRMRSKLGPNLHVGRPRVNHSKWPLRRTKNPDEEEQKCKLLFF